MLFCFFGGFIAQLVFSVQCASDSSESYSSQDWHGNLELLQIVFRHGDRTPTSLYPTDPNRPSAFAQGLSQLTQLGKLQQFQLGRLLRRRYSHFLTSDPRDVDVLSSFEDHSVNSALSHLATLYAPSAEWQFMPNYDWQPIPVQYIHGDFDKYVGVEPHCPKLVSETNKIIKSKEGREYIYENKDLYQYWSTNSGKSISNWIDVRNLYSTLKIEKANGLEVPLWAKHYWEQLKNISDASYAWSYSTKLSLKLSMGPFIQLMIDRMRLKTMEDDPSPQSKVYLYSTHDTNIAALMNAMSRFNGIEPPYCATLIFELYKDYDFYTIRMFYYNSSTPETGYQEPHPITIRGCGEYCPLAFFANAFRDFIPKDWAKLCGLRKDDPMQWMDSGPSMLRRGGAGPVDPSLSMLP